MHVASDALGVVADLYHQGRYLQAYEASRPLGPLSQWRGAAARVLAGRLAHNLGASRLGTTLHRLALREHPDVAEVRYFYALGMFHRRGPWRTWQWIQQAGEPAGAADGVLADWSALLGRVLAHLRDFERAEHWMDRALELAPQRPWVWIERAGVLEVEDRHADALAASREALRLRPWYRPAVQSVAHDLLQLGRDEEALTLLVEAADRLESGDVIAQLAALQTELEDYASARSNYERIERYYPLLDRDKHRHQWLLARRADAAYHCGDHQAAAELLAGMDDPFWRQFAERLADRDTPRARIVLPVTFVRQHYDTCAPATLASLSRYWQRPIDHVELADEICYDGTPAHVERRWAESHDWLVREFRVTIESARSLVDRGVPFALTTVGPAAGHMQAVIGYDEIRGTLIVRDPTERYTPEYVADRLLEYQSSSGPRGMIMLPADQAARLDGLELPDAQLYDLYQQVAAGLDEFDRPRAAAALAALEQTAPEHRLTIHARGAIASYDGDPTGMLEAVRTMLRQFPDDLNLQLAELHYLRELGRRDERLSRLEEWSASPQADPLVWRRLAEELIGNAREHDRIVALVKQVLARRPLDGIALALWADVHWDQLRRDLALDLYRLSACLEEKDEGRARAYFIAARHCRHTDAALKLLRDRFVRLGRRSSAPACTLCWALEQLEQSAEAMQVLDDALALRPGDGDLMLYAVGSYLACGRDTDAKAMLERARGVSAPAAWLRTAAHLASWEGDLRRALDCWRQVAALAPLAREAHQMIASLLADLESPDAAIAHLGNVVERFPHSLPLRTLLVEWLRSQPPEEAEAAVRQLLEFFPHDAWAHRELGFILVRRHGWDEALAQADVAAALEPASPVADYLRGRVHLLARGDVALARECFRRAIRLSIDYELAISDLLESCQTRAERQAELQFIYEELSRQVIFGDGLLTYADLAATTLTDDELLAVLREALDHRPDLWHAWSACARQLARARRWDEAHELARAAVERFPFLPRVWLDLARVCRGRDDLSGAIEALERALELNPSWSDAARDLAELHEQRNESLRALSILQQAVARDPREARNHAFLADTLRRLDRRDEALERIRHAVQLEPGYEWAWNMLRQWSRELDRYDLALQAARRLTETRPREARSWLVLADVLDAPEQQAERLEALERAIAVFPRSVDAHDQRADLLAQLGRADEALAACRPDVFGSDVPLRLQAREADLLFRSGQQGEAFARMRAVVAADRDYLWAWYRLADWHAITADGSSHEYLEAAEQLVRLAPHLAMSWGYRGDARRRQGDRGAAVADFEQSLRCEPDYNYGAVALVDMLIDDRRLDEAAGAIDRAAAALSPCEAAGFQCRICVLRRDHYGAMTALDEACRTAGDEAFPLIPATSAMADAGWIGTAERVLATRLATGQAGLGVAIAWVELFPRSANWRLAVQRLGEWDPASDVWHAVADRLIAALSRAGQHQLLENVIRRYDKPLRAHNDTWAAVGNALSDLRQSAAVVKWAADWQQRAGVEPWMLVALAINLRALNRGDDATRVSQAALELESDNGCGYHHVLLALDDVLAARGCEAQSRLEQVDFRTISPYYQYLAKVAAATAEALVTHAQRRIPIRFKHVASRLNALRRQTDPPPPEDPWVRKTWWRCFWTVAEAMNARPQAIWFCITHIWSG